MELVFFLTDLLLFQASDMVSASACIHVAVVQKKSRTPELKHHVRQKETSAETGWLLNFFNARISSGA